MFCWNEQITNGVVLFLIQDARLWKISIRNTYKTKSTIIRSRNSSHDATQGQQRGAETAKQNSVTQLSYVLARRTTTPSSTDIVGQKGRSANSSSSSSNNSSKMMIQANLKYTQGRRASMKIAPTQNQLDMSAFQQARPLTSPLCQVTSNLHNFTIQTQLISRGACL